MKVGDTRLCPECEGKGKVVWISDNRKTVAIKCSKIHLGKRDTIFLVKQRISVIDKQDLKKKWMQ